MKLAVCMRTQYLQKNIVFFLFSILRQKFLKPNAFHQVIMRKNFFAAFRYGSALHVSYVMFRVIYCNLRLSIVIHLLIIIILIVICHNWLYY